MDVRSTAVPVGATCQGQGLRTVLPHGPK
jgi:hypothetical protein